MRLLRSRHYIAINACSALFVVDEHRDDDYEQFCIFCSISACNESIESNRSRRSSFAFDRVSLSKSNRRIECFALSFLLVDLHDDHFVFVCRVENQKVATLHAMRHFARKQR